MLVFDFNNKSYKSGNVTADHSNCSILDNYEKKQGVLHLSENSYVSFPEAKIEYNETKYRICISFYIDPSAPDKMALLTGTSVPLSIILTKTNKGTYLIEAGMTVNGNTRSVVSKKTVSKKQWYQFEFVLLDGEFFFTINGKEYGRRCYAGVPGTVQSSDKKHLYLGYCKKSQATKGFVGYIDSISFSNAPTAENLQKASELAATGYMEPEGKIQDLQYSSVNLGALVSGNNLFTDQSKCFYNIYKNGVIVWSPDYKCVWMPQKIFNKFLSLIKNTAIGFPIEDVQAIYSNVNMVVFDGGAIFDVPDVPSPVFLPGNMFTEYAKAKDTSADYGYPVSDLISINAGSEDSYQYMKFTNYTMFSFRETGIFQLDDKLSGLYQKRFNEFGAIDSSFDGYDSSLAGSDWVTSNIKCTYYHCQKAIFCYYKSISKFTANEYKIITMDPDIFEYFINSDGLNESEKYGKYLYPEAEPLIKVRSGKSFTYQDFRGGVIYKTKNSNAGNINASYSVFGCSDVRITLSEIVAHGDIYDYGYRDAELYIKVFIGRNEKYNIVNEKRWPDNADNGGTGFYIRYSKNSADKEHPMHSSVYYDIPNIHGSDIIYFHVKVYDYDPVSDNDYLGSYTLTLDMSSGWGILEDPIPDAAKDGFENTNNIAIYHALHLMHQGSDNRHGAQNIRFTFRIQNQIKNVDIDQYFRRYAYWAIDNFRAKDYVLDANGIIQTDKKGDPIIKDLPLSRSMYNSVFHANSGKWYDWILNFWDSVWYYLVRDQFGGEGGLCFGLSTAAMESIHGYGRYPIPLDDWYPDAKNPPNATGKPNYHNNHTYYSDVMPYFADMIRRRNIYQGGWEHVKHFMDMLFDGVALIPPTAFSRIKKLLRSDKYCLVNLFENTDKDKGYAHTVIAYKYEDDKIFIADSNHPWIDDPDRDNPDAPHDYSYIKLTSDPVRIVDVYAYNSSTGKSEKVSSYRYCYPTPFSVISSHPTVPSWASALINIVQWFFHLFTDFIINNAAGFTIMLIAGDAEVEKVDGFLNISDEIGIPNFSADKPSYKANGFQFRVAVVPDHLELKIKGTKKGKYSQYIFGRNKIITINAETAKNEKDQISITNLSTGSPTVSVTSGKQKHFDIKVEKMITKYGSQAGKKENVYYPADDEDKEFQKAQLNPPGKIYYVNTNEQRNGDHEIHVESCKYLPKFPHRCYLGRFMRAEHALLAAKSIFPQTNGCSYCCIEINTDRIF